MNIASAHNMQSVALPKTLPVFPLTGVLLLPRGQLPLNIFEPRYLAMVEDALKGDRLIGMIQPRDFQQGLTGDRAPLFPVGCAGKITSFEETEDGRYLITLTGVSRFHIVEETPITRGYRQGRVDWTAFPKDREANDCLGIDRNHLKDLLRNYFDLQGLSCSWDAIDSASDDKLMTALAMICPLDPGEKQALLEADCCRTRAKMFMTMLEMAVHNDKGGCDCGGRH